MADGLLFENCSVFISQPIIVVFSMKFGMQIHDVSISQVTKFCYSKCRSSTILKIDFRLYLWYCARDRNSCAMPRESAASWCEKNHFAPGCSMLPLATLHTTTTTARSCCYLSNHCQRIDRFCRTARMICECSPVQAVIV